MGGTEIFGSGIWSSGAGVNRQKVATRLALYAEVAKLKIELRSDRVLDGGGKPLATVFATARVKGRNRWRNSVTPSGIEPEIAP